MLGICTLLFAFNLNTYDVSKLFVVAKAFIGKSRTFNERVHYVKKQDGRSYQRGSLKDFFHKPQMSQRHDTNQYQDYVRSQRPGEDKTQRRKTKN